MHRYLRPTTTFLLASAAILLSLWPSLAQAPDARPSPAMTALPRPASGGTRGPSALVFSRDGRWLYLAEQDTSQVAVLEAESGRLEARIPCGGEQPTGLALAPDGRTLVAANQFSGSLGILDLEKRALRQSVPLPGGPCEVAIAPSGHAFVSMSQLDQVAVVDLASGQVTDRIPLGRAGRRESWVTPWEPPRLPEGHRPRALALSQDGKTLLCASANGETVSVIDTETCKEVVAAFLPAFNVRGIALSPDGTRAFLTGQRPHFQFSTARPEETWSNFLLTLRVAGRDTAYEDAIPLDLPDRGAADPTGVALAGPNGPIVVTLAGTHEAALVSGVRCSVFGVREGESCSSSSSSSIRIDFDFVFDFDFEPNTEHSTTSLRSGTEHRLSVGANPRAVAVRPGTQEIWVANHLGNSLSVLTLKEGEGTDPTAPSLLTHHSSLITYRVSRTLDLGPPAKQDRRLNGRFLFTSAHMARGMRFSCNTCHPDGNTDGLSWRFAHVKDGIERRNSRNLRGTVLLTAPYRWAPREEDFEEFVNDEVHGLFGHPKLPHGELHALWDLANELPLPPNPHRSPDGTFTEAARRGKALFVGKAACASCHGGSQAGGTGKAAWIGTTRKGLKLDVPHLAGAYDSAPYLHDGRAATLEQVFTLHDAPRLHGKAHLLTPEERRDLLEYVRQL